MTTTRILVVDDDPDVIVYLALLLEDNGFEVATASDVRSALRQLESARPDVVIMDVVMPGKSGLDLLVTLRSDERYAEIPILLVTGSDQLIDDDCRSYLENQPGLRGPDGVHGKPIEPEELLDTIRTALAS